MKATLKTRSGVWACLLLVCGCVCAALALGGCGESAQAPAGRATPPEAPQAKDAATPAPEIVETPTGLKMAHIPAGTFTMGDDSGADDERPAHTVKVPAFWMDVCEVTQRSYQALMGRSPARFKNDEQPVEQVGWFDAAQYCNARSLREGLMPCYDLDAVTCDYNANGYRLPTEAEWEYACRAGAATAYSFGDDARSLLGHAWFEDNAGKTTHPVAQKAANAWGLYDMHGNVWEWCNDWYSPTFYAASPMDAPHNDTVGEERVLRGGGWNSPADQCRASARYSVDPVFTDVCFGYDAYGFRCVRRDTGANKGG